MYRYFSIRGDASYQTFLAPEDVIARLLKFPQLVRRTPNSFEHHSEDAWFLVNLLHCNEDGCYASDGEIPTRINLIEIIAGTGAEKAHSIASEIARNLRWELIEES